MPGEPVGAVHVDALLSNLAKLYRPTEFIADSVCPRLDVKHESDLFPVFGQDDFYGTDVDDLVADRAAPKMIEFTHTTDRYQCQRRELGWDISDRERQNADSQLNLERNKQIGTLGRLYLKREIRVAALLRKTTNGGKLALGANATGKWDTAATTTIETDVWTARETMRQAIGVRPNTIIIPEAVASGMQKNTQIGAKLQYTYGSSDQRPLLSDYFPVLPPILFGLKVMVPGLIQNTAHEGAAGSYSDVWSEQVRVLYLTSGPATDVPSVAYTFQSEPLSTRTWRSDAERKDNYAVGFTIDERVVASSAGYEINDCLV